MSAAGLSIAITADATGLFQGLGAAQAQIRSFADAVATSGGQMANVFAAAGNAARQQSANAGEAERSQDAILANWAANIARADELDAGSKSGIAARGRALTRDEEAENQQRLQSWRSVIGEIDSAEATLVRDILSRRQKLSVDLLQIGTQLLESEIGNDLKYYTNHLLYNALGLADDQKTAQGGLLVHLLSETQQTSATAMGVATRTEAAESGAAAGKAAQAAAGSATIASDAMQAAAGTYAAVAQIPLVGPFLAPAAAAGAFAAVMAYDSLASLDVGAWNVPRDMIANIHQGEMVVPQNFASGLRGANLGGGGDVHATYAPTIHAPASSSLEQLLRDEHGMMLAWFGARLRDGSLRSLA